MLKFFKSVRGKLTLSFLAVFGVMIIFFSIVIYNIQSFQYMNSIDNAMKILAESLNEEIQKSGFEDDIFDEIQEMYIPFTATSQHFVELNDSSGGVVLKSFQLKDYTLFAPENSLDTTFQYQTYYPSEENSLWNEQGLRILYYPIRYQAKKYIIIIGVPLSTLQNSLHDIRLVYYISIPLTLLISCVIGWLLSKRVYKPVMQITQKANNITAENLGSRLPVNKTDDELAILSKTLNNMIERLEKSFQTLKQFTSDASHELRTPLTILRGQIEVCLEKKRNVEEYESVLKSNLDEVLRLQLIVDRLLFLNQLESGRFSLDKKLVNINELVIDVITKINFIAVKRDIKINLDIHDKDIDGSEVYGDYGSLFMVVFNILENAIKYSTNNSEIYCNILYDTTHRTINIIIKDKGIGITEADMEHIFDRFYRADISRTRDKTISLGLGLPIAKRIVENHKGRIEVASIFGTGSDFKIILPFHNTIQ